MVVFNFIAGFEGYCFIWIIYKYYTDQNTKCRILQTYSNCRTQLNYGYY